MIASNKLLDEEPGTLRRHTLCVGTAFGDSLCNAATSSTAALKNINSFLLLQVCRSDADAIDKDQHTNTAINPRTNRLRPLPRTWLPCNLATMPMNDSTHTDVLRCRQCDATMGPPTHEYVQMVSLQLRCVMLIVPNNEDILQHPVGRGGGNEPRE